MRHRLSHLAVGTALSLGASAPTSGQASLAVGTERHVAADPDGRPMVEPHLSVDPTDPDHLLVGVIVVSADMSESDCATLRSLDGGATWVRHDFGVARCGDPWGVILEDGSAIMTVLAARPGDRPADEAPLELLVYRSEDGGRTWPDEPVSLGAGHDHQTLALDRSGGPRDGALYVASLRDVRREGPERYAGAVFIARSDDGGRTFETFTHVLTGLSQNPQEPVVLDDGRLLVPYSDYGRRTPEGQARLEPERDWVVYSADGGETISPPFMITDECARSWSELSLDRTDGPHAGRLYYACSDGDYERILVVRSDDALAWYDPVAVNQESGRRPYARTPALALGPDGTVGVSFSDGRGSGSFMHVFRCQRMYFTASLDGGDTWIPEVAVSGEPSCPIGPRNGTAGMRFPAGGDYHGLAALPDGSFRIVWSDARSGVFELWTNTVRIER